MEAPAFPAPDKHQGWGNQSTICLIDDDQDVRRCANIRANVLFGEFFVPDVLQFRAKFGRSVNIFPTIEFRRNQRVAALSS